MLVRRFDIAKRTDGEYLSGDGERCIVSNWKDVGLFLVWEVRELPIKVLISVEASHKTIPLFVIS